MKAKHIIFNESGKILRTKICTAWLTWAENPVDLEISLGDGESVDIKLEDIFKEIIKNLKK